VRRIETIGNATLYFGDCREIVPALRKADAVVTDPPYGIGRNFDTPTVRAKQKDGELWRREWGAMTGDDKPFDPLPWIDFSRVVLWGANWFCNSLTPATRWLVWDKIKPERWSFSQCELAWTNIDGGGVRIHKELWHGFCRGNEIREHAHPTQKPITLMQWCIQQIKLPVGSLILDPFMGTGSTGIAAYRQDMRFIGVECHEPYYDVACKRIEEANKQSPLPFNGPAISVMKD